MDGKGSRRHKILNNLVQDFNNKLEFVNMSHLPLEILKKTAFYSCKFCEIVCNICWKFKGQKPRPMKISHDVFCEPETPWNFWLLFLQYPWKFHVLKPLFHFNFFWNSPMMEVGSNGSELVSHTHSLLLLGFKLEYFGKSIA